MKIPILFIGAGPGGSSVEFYHGHLETGVPPVAGAEAAVERWLMLLPGEVAPQPERRPIKNS
jgi:hypothetical protein